MKAIFKNTYREIFRSPGRFIAILAIIILGSGFLVGLRVSRKGMLRTGVRYLESQSFFDFTVATTIGVEEADVEAFRDMPGVRAVEGVFQIDALVSKGGAEEYAYAFYSLPESVSLPAVVEGRLPASENECLADSQSGLRVGDVVTVTANNSEDTLDIFSVREFTVSGRCTSPLYLNYERGGTSIGHGSISAFVYVLPDVFDADYYTSLAIAAEDMPTAYTKAYNDRADELEPGIRALAEERAVGHYERVRSEALAELAKGEKEYEDGVKEYKDKRAEAEQELADALSELEDAKRKLEDGERELADGRAELDKKRKEAQNQFRDAEKQLEDAKAQLENGEAAYASSVEEYEKNLDAYHKSAADIESRLAPYNERQAELDAVRAELTKRQNAQNAVLNGIVGYIKSNGGTDYRSGDALLVALRLGRLKAISETKSALPYVSGAPSSVTALLNNDTELQRDRAAYLSDAAAFAREIAPLTAEKAVVDATGAALATAQRQLEAARKQLEDGWAQYEDGKAELENARRDADRQLRDAEKQLDDAEREIADGWKEYEDGVRQYEDAKREAEEDFLDAEHELEDAREELDDAKRRIEDLASPTVYVLGRWSNVGYVCFENDTTIVENVAKVFPMFFFLIAALVCVTTVTRMVDEQRSQLGVLMALGYSKSAIMSKFLIYSGAASVLGGLIGIAVGSIVIPWVVWEAYKIMYYFSDSIVFTFDWALSAATFLAYLLTMWLVTWTACRKELMDTPANVIRPKPPKAGKRVLLERVGFIWNRLSFMWKVSLRNMFRSPERALMMILGVAGCTALMITGHGIRDSISGVVDAQYEEITFYDMSATFSDGLNKREQTEFLSAMEGKHSGALLLHQSSVTAASGKSEKEATLTVINSDGEARIGEFMDFHSGAEPVPFPKKGETILNHALAEALNVSAGDRITLRTDDWTFDITVSGVFDNYIYNYIVISDDTFIAQRRAPADINTAFFIRSDGDGGELSAALLGNEHVINVTENNIMRERINAMLGALNYIVLLTIVCAAALAFTVIYNLTNINITERLREIATVKVLGFFDLESATYVLRENVVMTVIGGLAGVPLGIALNAFVIAQIKVDLISFSSKIAPSSFVVSFAYTIVFSLLVDVFMCLRLNKINTAEALKAAE